MESPTLALPSSSPALVQGVSTPPAQGWLRALELTHLLLLAQRGHSLTHSLTGASEPDVPPWIRSQLGEEQGPKGN